MAGDVSWLPAETDELIIEAAGEAVVTLSVFDSQVRATTASGAWTMPIADGVRVILDGPAIEISSQPGNLGLGVSPRGSGTRFAPRAARLVCVRLKRVLMSCRIRWQSGVLQRSTHLWNASELGDAPRQNNLDTPAHLVGPDHRWIAPRK